MLRLTIAASFALVATSAAAQDVGHIEVGSVAGYTAFDPSVGLANQSAIGARVSFLVGVGPTSVVLEGDGQEGKQQVGTTTVGYTAVRARILYNASLASHVSVLYGLGGVRNHLSMFGNYEWGISPLVGFRFGLGDFAAIRIDGLVDFFPNPANKSSSTPATAHYGGQAGISVPLWRSTHSNPPPPVVAAPAPTPAPVLVAAKPVIVEAPPLDSDGDGVPDAFDRCPNTPRGTKVDRFGCPLDPPAPLPETPRRTAPPPPKCPNTPPGIPIDVNGCPVLFKAHETVLTLRGVNFLSGRAQLLRSSRVRLDTVATALLAHPEVKIEVAGHTDNRGKIVKNWRLSQQRAEAVRVYLAIRGVPLDRMTARGYGDAEPVTTNRTKAGRARNRRVELRKTN